MATLDGFRELDFLEQITTLNEIAAEKNSAALPGLVDLLKNPVGDASIDYMVSNTIHAMLSRDEAATLSHLAGGDDALTAICIRVAGEARFASCAPAIAAAGEAAQESERLVDALTALLRLQAPEALPLARRHLTNADPFIAALCIEIAGVMRDDAAVPELMKVVSDNEASDHYERCDVTTWKAVEALAAMGTPQTLGFLADHIHHKNPTARRIITDALVQVGEPAVPLLGASLEAGGTDDRILAANLLGFIGHKKGADILVALMDKGTVTDPNLRYAVFEALGRIGTMKGLVCLMDGLKETEDLTLMAVVTGLERHVSPGLTKTLASMLTRADDQSERIAKAVISSQCVKLFDALYEFEGAADSLMDALACSQDRETVAAFRSALEEIGGDRAQADLARLPQTETSQRKALAADDSKSMLAMHRTILTEMGFEPLLAANGQEALAFIEAGEPVDVIITDMNMPIMDGMEFVEKLRACPGYEATPVIMVTTESEASQRSLIQRSGISALLVKPFKPDQLKAKVQALLGR